MKEGWEYKKLLEVCDFQGGAQPPKSEWIDHEEIGYVRMLQIRDYTQSRNVSPEYVKLTKRTKCCSQADIMIGRYGASLGKILTGLEGAYNVAIMKTIPNEKILAKQYLRFYLLSNVFQNFLLHIGGRAAQAGFSKEDLGELQIPIPPLSEQHRIVSYFDSSFAKIDEMKANAAKALSEAKALFQAELKKCMEKKEGWEVKRLENVTFFRNGVAHEKDMDKDKGRYVVVNSKFISTNGHVRKYCDVQLSPLYKNEIVMVMSDVPRGKSLAKCYMIDADDEYTLNQRICAFSNHKIDTRFLFYQLNRHPYLLEFDNGENQTNLRKGDILYCPIYFPDSKETQHQIVAHLDSLSQKVNELQHNYNTILAECDALKQAILKETFE